MAYKYFIYKLNNITGVGGITPPQPTNGDLGLSAFNDWYLGRVDDTNLDYFNKVQLLTQLDNELEIHNTSKLKVKI